jgi:hypothetical protein
VVSIFLYIYTLTDKLWRTYFRSNSCLIYTYNIEFYTTYIGVKWVRPFLALSGSLGGGKEKKGRDVSVEVAHANEAHANEAHANEAEEDEGEQKRSHSPLSKLQSETIDSLDDPSRWTLQSEEDAEYLSPETGAVDTTTDLVGVLERAFYGKEESEEPAEEQEVTQQEKTAVVDTSQSNDEDIDSLKHSFELKSKSLDAWAERQMQRNLELDAWDETIEAKKNLLEKQKGIVMDYIKLHGAATATFLQVSGKTEKDFMSIRNYLLQVMEPKIVTLAKKAMESAEAARENEKMILADIEEETNKGGIILVAEEVEEVDDLSKSLQEMQKVALDKRNETLTESMAKCQDSIYAAFDKETSVIQEAIATLQKFISINVKILNEEERRGRLGRKAKATALLREVNETITITLEDARALENSTRVAFEAADVTFTEWVALEQENRRTDLANLEFLEDEVSITYIYIYI